MYPIGNHSPPAPCSRMSPATPSTLAAERYSPPMALAFHQGLTVREAT